MIKETSLNQNCGKNSECTYNGAFLKSISIYLPLNFHINISYPSIVKKPRTRLFSVTVDLRICKV